MYEYLKKNALTVVRCCAVGVLLGFGLWSAFDLALSVTAVLLNVFLGFSFSVMYCRYLPITPLLVRIFYISLAFNALLMVFEIPQLMAVCLMLMLELVSAIIGRIFNIAIRDLSISYLALLIQLIIILLSSAGFFLLCFLGSRNHVLPDLLLNNYQTSIYLLVTALIVYIEFITLRPARQQSANKAMMSGSEDSALSDSATGEKITAKYENQFAEIAFNHGLTNRQLDVLKLLFRGRTAKHIAAQLYISQNTVKAHQRNIYQKLSINSQQELIDYIEDRNAKTGRDDDTR